MTTDPRREELEQAHHIIRCLLHMAGGRVEISDELVVSMDRHRLVQVDTNLRGGMTLMLEPRQV